MKEKLLKKAIETVIIGGTTFVSSLLAVAAANGISNLRKKEKVRKQREEEAKEAETKETETKETEVKETKANETAEK